MTLHLAAAVINHGRNNNDDDNNDNNDSNDNNDYDNYNTTPVSVVFILFENAPYPVGGDLNLRYPSPSRPEGTRRNAAVSVTTGIYFRVSLAG